MGLKETSHETTKKYFRENAQSKRIHSHHHSFNAGSSDPDEILNVRDSKHVIYPCQPFLLKCCKIKQDFLNAIMEHNQVEHITA